MKCENNCKQGKAVLILVLNGRIKYVCSDCYIDMQGLRGDFNHWKKEQKS
jgi:hypothetical protein